MLPRPPHRPRCIRCPRQSLCIAALTSESAIASGNEANPPAFKYVGLALAVGSGVLIGSSFVFKKKGLLAAQKKYETAAGEGHAYLKSAMWWTGMIVMVFGEIFNFVAYAFADAVLVTPLGALSVVICAVLSSIFLKEKLTLFGKVGCFLCIVGSVIIALNAPTSHVGGKITEFQKLFLAPGFLTWAGVCIVASLVLIFVFAPKYGKKNMMIYITVCSLIGGLSVSVTSGLGSAILLSIRGQNQFKHWFIYFLLGFVVITLLIEINYLNKALELFNTATVTPTYYVIFTGATSSPRSSCSRVSMHPPSTLSPLSWASSSSAPASCFCSSAKSTQTSFRTSQVWIATPRCSSAPATRSFRTVERRPSRQPTRIRV